MSKPWFSSVPEGSGLKEFWEARNAIQEKIYQDNLAKKNEKIQDAVAHGVVTAEIGDARKRKFITEERDALTFYGPEDVGKRIEEKNPVFLRDAATGSQIHASGKELIEKILTVGDSFASRAMMEFFAADLEVPLDRLWKEPPKTEPVPAPATLPAVKSVEAATQPDVDEDGLPPPTDAAGIVESSVGVPATAIAEPPPPLPPEEKKPDPKPETKPETKPSGKSSKKAAERAPSAEKPPTVEKPPGPGAIPELRFTNCTESSVVVAALARPDGTIEIQLLPDDKQMMSFGGVHCRHSITRFTRSPESEQKADYETVTLQVVTPPK